MLDHAAIGNVIRSALEKTAGEGSHDASVARDVAFHMTDWLQELERFHAFCVDPERASPEHVSDVLYGFLVHAPAHVAAAAKLLTGQAVTDVFEVGAVEC